MLTATITPSVRPTPFDAAFAAALACGWTGEAAFAACCCMRAHGMLDVEIEAAFRDAALRIQ